MANSIPTAEAAERIAEGLPGLALAGRAIGLADHQRMLADHARRLHDAHKIQARALGAEDLVTEAEDEDMSIVICGDGCFNTQPAASAEPIAATPAASTDAGGGVASKLATAAKLAAIMAGCGSVPLAGVGLHSLLSGPAEAPQVQEAPAPDLSGYGVQVEKAPPR